MHIQTSRRPGANFAVISDVTKYASCAVRAVLMYICGPGAGVNVNMRFKIYR